MYGFLNKILELNNREQEEKASIFKGDLRATHDRKLG
jgi:hypothetical protein